MKIRGSRKGTRTATTISATGTLTRVRQLIPTMRALTGTFRCVKCSSANPNLPKLTSPSPSSSSLVSNSDTKSKSRPCLKQHNGELRGGAKSSRAGRPWVCACIIYGFTDRSEACVLESKWKAFSRRVLRKRQNDDPSLALLQHRQEALNRVKGSLDCNHLEINWHLNPL